MFKQLEFPEGFDSPKNFHQSVENKDQWDSLGGEVRAIQRRLER
jgi:hypothetical protein